ncbi:MAP kinase-activating death domain protein, partial [Plakobranchus ocellatus]
MGHWTGQVHVLPKSLQPPLMFALPDNTRFSLVDFPLHLPLELLGVDTCLQALTAIMLEHKVILQSRDYNALSMSVMAFVSMLYPLEYMFPVIPLLPTCMASAEQLLLAPTPYLIGVPASFFGYKKGFPLPDDIWVVDLDANKIVRPPGAEILPPLPEPEGTALKIHLKQNPDLWTRRDSLTTAHGYNPLIFGNDVDSVDVATRVAMVKFLDSSNTLGNFTEHTRTLRLYPRPVVAFQLYSFLKSRSERTAFTAKLARTQAVEYLSEWSLCPTNVVYQRVQTKMYDPSLIGDKPKWFAQQLQLVDFHAYDQNSSLGAAVQSVVSAAQERAAGGSGGHNSDDGPTDESGSDSDGAESTSSSYSSLSDFVSDLYNSDIRGETPSFQREMQILAVDEAEVYSPPSQLHLPGDRCTNSDSALSLQEDTFQREMQILAVDEAEVYSPPSQLHLPGDRCTNSDSALSLQEDSDMSSSGSSSPSYSQTGGAGGDSGETQETVFRYDSGNTIDTSLRSDANSSRTPAAAAVSPHSPRLGRTSSGSSLPRTPPPRPSMPPNSPSARMTPPLARKAAPNLGPGGLRPPPGPGPRRPTKSGSEGDRSSPSSLISALSNELTDMAHSASNTVSELFGSNKQGQGGPAPPVKPAAQKPFTHLGNRKALVERSGLVKHSSTIKAQQQKETAKAPVEPRAITNSENQQFLKEVISSVLEGKGVSWMKVSRVNKLMEDENYRNFVVSRLNCNMDQKLPEDAVHIEDVMVSKQVLKGMLSLIKAIIHGLGHTINNHGLGGMASAYMVLEIAHTHYWARDPSSNKSDASLTPERMSLHGSHESLNSPVRKLSDGVTTSKWWSVKRGSNPTPYKTPSPSHPLPQPPISTTATSTISTTKPANLNTIEPNMSSPSTESGSPVVLNGEEFENIEITSISDDGGGTGFERGVSLEQLDRPDNQMMGSSGGREGARHHPRYVITQTSGRMHDRNGNPAKADPMGGGDTTSGFMSSSDWNKNAAVKQRQQQQRRQQQQHQGGAYSPQDQEAEGFDSGAPSCDIIVTDAELQGHGDMLREMVKNKELMKTSKLDRKFSSLDSEMSEASTLVSTNSDKDDLDKRRHRINHQSIRSAMSDSEMESNWMGSSANPHRSRSSSIWSTKSAYTSGYRYHDGKLLHTGNLGLSAADPGGSGQGRQYLFEGLVGKDRSRVWDHLQFWEDMFLDAVAQERDIIGMDQRPSEMMERYNSLGDLEKKRLELDEDKLLSVMLYNQAAFMLMMRVPKNDIKKKVRRLLGKSHIGLQMSQDINNLLDNIQNL